MPLSQSAVPADDNYAVGIRKSIQKSAKTLVCINRILLNLDRIYITFYEKYQARSISVIIFLIDPFIFNILEIIQ